MSTQKTGQELLAYLKETGTGAPRREIVELFLKQHKDATAAEVLEYCIQERVQPGTIEKIGKWVHDDTFAYTNPDTRPPNRDEELDALRTRVAELERRNAELAAKNHAMLQENARLRKVADVREAQEPGLRSKSFEDTKPSKREPALAGAR